MFMPPQPRWLRGRGLAGDQQRDATISLRRGLPRGGTKRFAPRAYHEGNRARVSLPPGRSESSHKRLLNWLYPGLGDDVAPLYGFGRYEFCELLRPHDPLLCALLGEFLPQRRILERGGELLVQFGDDRLRSSFRRQQH